MAAWRARGRPGVRRSGRRSGRKAAVVVAAGGEPRTTPTPALTTTAAMPSPAPDQRTAGRTTSRAGAAQAALVSSTSEASHLQQQSGSPVGRPSHDTLTTRFEVYILLWLVRDPPLRPPDSHCFASHVTAFTSAILNGSAPEFRPYGRYVTRHRWRACSGRGAGRGGGCGGGAY